jgi:hypothetical protein
MCVRLINMIHDSTQALLYLDVMMMFATTTTTTTTTIVGAAAA